MKLSYQCHYDSGKKKKKFFYQENNRIMDPQLLLRL